MSGKRLEHEVIYQGRFDILNGEFVNNNNALMVAERGKERFSKRALRLLASAGSNLAVLISSGAVAIPLAMNVSERYSFSAGYERGVGDLLGVSTLMVIMVAGMITGSEVGRQTEKFLRPRKVINLAVG